MRYKKWPLETDKRYWTCEIYRGVGTPWYGWVKVIDLHKLEKESLADLGDRSRQLKGKGCRESGYVPNPQTLVKLEDATIETRAAYDLDDYEGYRNLTPKHKGYKRLKFHKKIN